jgi:uncharacterized membrane protein YfcA
MTLFLVLLVIFFAVFTQSLAGFGSALVAMSLLPALLGIRVATPLVALIAVTIELFLLLRYRSALNLRAVWRLTLAAVIGIPLGVLALRRVDEGIVLALLGAVIAGYALYGLLNLTLPELKRPAWAYGFGFLAGMLGGAYNTSGPPAVIYGDCQRWSPAEFKSNLQGFFLLSDAIVVATHGLGRNLVPAVLHSYLWALPIIALGILSGISLDRYLDPASFRKVVLALLVLMGLRMLVTSLLSLVE